LRPPPLEGGVLESINRVVDLNIRRLWVSGLFSDICVRVRFKSKVGWKR